VAQVVVANGAFKSGSTWLHELVKGLLKAKPIPESWRRTDWKNPSIHERDLEAFLTWAAATPGGPFCFKAHYPHETEADLLQRMRTPVLNIQRDLRDVLVSAYYHYLRLGTEVGTTVNEYYTSFGGREMLDEVVRYHGVWSSSRPNVFVLGYEELLADPARAIGEAASWLGVAATEGELAALAHRHEFQRRQQKERNEKPGAELLFFRKGVAGDWVEHLSAPIAAEIAALNDALPPRGGSAP
jgi:hypothetical protein